MGPRQEKVAMRARLFSVLALAAVIVGSAQAEMEGPCGVDEPWAGWWWPIYCTATGACSTCLHSGHLWMGPPVTEGGAGPIYKLDTKYFWRHVPLRYQAQEWEKAHHRRTPPGGSPGDCHCNGLACASILEPEPPDDCGVFQGHNT
jgi:hypothetical protein